MIMTTVYIYNLSTQWAVVKIQLASSIAPAHLTLDDLRFLSATLFSKP